MLWMTNGRAGTMIRCLCGPTTSLNLCFYDWLSIICSQKKWWAVQLPSSFCSSGNESWRSFSGVGWNIIIIINIKDIIIS